MTGWEEKMSENLTEKISENDTDKLILRAVKDLDAHVHSSLDQLTRWVNSIDSRLKHLELKVDQRLHDTRPIWHKVVADIEQFQAGQQRLEESLLELNSTVRDVSRDQIVINDSLRRIQLDLLDFDERFKRCEVNRRPPNS